MKQGRWGLATVMVLATLGASGTVRLVSAPAEHLATAGARQTGEPEAVRFELPNGLRVWVQEDHRRPVVRVEALYKVGWINEGPGITGIAHYVEHMAFRATENVRNEDIFGFIDRIGGRWTGGTGQMGTSYAETVPAWALDEVLRIEAERMSRALFDRTEFERERSSVITEANGYVATEPLEILNEELLASSFEVHPYRYGSGTWARDNLVATRDETYDFYRRYYGPDNAVLAVIGDISVDDARALIEMHFGPLEGAGRSGEVRIVEPPQRTEKALKLVAPADEARLEIVYRAPAADDPDYPTLAVLDRLLTADGGLQREVVAAGGTDVSTSFRPTPYPYVYRISITAEPAADLERLLAAVQGRIDRLGRDGVTSPQLESARAAAREAGVGGRRGTRRRGAGGGSSLPPSDPRESIAEIATRLTGSEVFPWEIDPATLDDAGRAQDEVTASDIERYVDRWLRTLQRTVGFLVPGESDFVPQWSDGRPILGGRLEIPPLTVPPAKRMRPDAVPDRALQPLRDAGIATRRLRLSNGVVLRAARRDGPTTALQLRIHLGDRPDPAGREGLSLLVARLIATDPQLGEVVDRLGAELSNTADVEPAEAANLGYVDLRLRFRAADTEPIVAAAARALRTPSIPSPRFETERERLLEELEAERQQLALAAVGGEPYDALSLGAEAQARRLVLARVAPGWHLDIPATPEAVRRITAEDVNGSLPRSRAGDAVVVSLVGPGDPGRLLEVLEASFSDYPAGMPRPAAAATADDANPGSTGPSGSTTEIGQSTAPKPATGTPVQAGGGAPAAASPDERVPLAGEFQATIVAGLPGVGRAHPDAAALELLNYIVGMPYYGGRLGWALTKGGLTYSTAATTTFGEATGHVLMATVCDTNNLEATLQAIREVIEKISDDGVDAWELREAQASMLGRMVLYGPGPDSSEEDIAAALLDSETTGVEMLDYPTRSHAVLAVTPEQVDAAARRYYRPGLLRIAAVGAVPATPGVSPFPAGTFRDLFD